MKVFSKGIRIISGLFKDLDLKHLEPAFELRSQVYSESNYLQTGESIIEADNEDKDAIHIIVLSKNMAVGYARVIVAECRTEFEVSRFCVHKLFRGKFDCNSVTSAIMGEVYLLSYKLEIYYCHMIIDKRFFRLCIRIYKFDIIEEKEAIYFMGSYCIPSIFNMMRTLKLNANNPIYRTILKYIDKQYDPTKNLYSRNWAYLSPKDQMNLKQATIFFAGLGLGSIFAQLAARTGFGNIIIADGDIVSYSNLNRQQFYRKHLGEYKSLVCAQLIEEINPNIKLTVIDHYLENDDLENLIPKCDVVVNTIDFDHPSFLVCNCMARKFSKPCIFPMNIGWGGIVMNFSHHSQTLCDFIGLNEDCDDISQIREKTILKAIEIINKDYLWQLVENLLSGTQEDWPCDPQMGVGAYITAALVIQSATAIVNNKKVMWVPEVIHFDTTPI